MPGRAWARREAIERPEIPPAQPRPNTGTRETSDRKPMRRATRASRLGVAMPVEQTVTTVSTSARVKVRVRQRLAGDIDEQRFRSLEKRLGALRPAARLEIPVERLHAVTLDDSGVGENAREPLVVRKAAAEYVPCRGQDVLLQESVGRNRCCQGDQGSRVH